MKEYPPGIYDTPQDMIYLRGDIVIIESADSESDVHPMMFISKNDNYKLEVKQKSMFLVGLIDYDVIEKSNRFYSNYIGNQSRLRKK